MLETRGGKLTEVGQDVNDIAVFHAVVAKSEVVLHFLTVVVEAVSSAVNALQSLNLLQRIGSDPTRPVVGKAPLICQCASPAALTLSLQTGEVV